MRLRWREREEGDEWWWFFFGHSTERFIRNEETVHRRIWIGPRTVMLERPDGSIKDRYSPQRSMLFLVTVSDGPDLFRCYLAPFRARIRFPAGEERADSFSRSCMIERPVRGFSKHDELHEISKISGGSY